MRNFLTSNPRKDSLYVNRTRFENGSLRMVGPASRRSPDDTICTFPGRARGHTGPLFFAI